MSKYNYYGDASFNDAYCDCKLVDGSIVDENSFQECDTGLILYHMDRILDALQKQTAKKLIETECTLRCPVCKKQVTNKGCIHSKIEYCTRCGQKFDWNLK